MKIDNSPVPTVMPIDREAWFQELHLSNFVNTYYQYRDVTKCVGKQPMILVIGPGQGLDTAVLKWRGCTVTTFDIDDTFKPDVFGSCHEMPMFSNAQFDVVIASHVVEHLPLRYLNSALSEIARVGRYALVYLPVAGRFPSVRFSPGFRGLSWSIIFNLCKFWEKPDGVTPKYCAGQHYWEVGYRGFRPADLRRRFSHFFELVDAYRNMDWLPSYNFVLKSKFKP